MGIIKTVDIFYKSYRKDFKLLEYSLKSIEKNVFGYNKIIILIPEKDKLFFETKYLPERTEVHYIDEYGNGYLYQQVCKIKAHNYSVADFIMFSDSDVIFDHKINLIDFIFDEKPEILHTPWNKVGEAICWKQPTETMMGESVPFEFMRRNCLIYHRQTLVNINQWQPNLEFIVMQSERFSEFNLMGAYAFKYEKTRYSFVDTENWIYTVPKGVQLWSWFDKNSQEAVHQREYERALLTINEALQLNLTEL